MKRRGARAQNILGLLLIGAVLIGLGGFAYAGLALRAPPVDSETLCRRDGEIAAHTIILVDASDRLEPRHRRKLAAVLDQERARLAQYDRITLMRLNARRPQEPTILFSKCLPRPPDQANPLFENPRQAQAQWDSEFAEALARAARSAQSGAVQPASPILAGLRAIAADPAFGPEIGKRRLVLVSDLLEHQPNGFSLYAEDADFSAWIAQAPMGPADLAEIDVRVAPLDRPDLAARQASALRAFWPAYFDAAGAHETTFDPIP